jgi:hypothetical protein
VSGCSDRPSHAKRLSHFRKVPGRRLTTGYARASRLIEMMAQTGIVGDYKGSQAREAMLTLEDWDAMKAQQAADAKSGMTV